MLDSYSRLEEFEVEGSSGMRGLYDGTGRPVGGFMRDFGSSVRKITSVLIKRGEWILDYRSVH